LAGCAPCGATPATLYASCTTTSGVFPTSSASTTPATFTVATAICATNHYNTAANTCANCATNIASNTLLAGNGVNYIAAGTS